MVDALIREVALNDFIRKPGMKIETIYFGGGTPSLLSEAELRLILAAIRQQYDIAPYAEITLEANPEDIQAASLQAWLQIGINRLSVGIQSFDDAELKWMRRTHSAEHSRQCLTEIKAAGFRNFSTDLIYGSPFQTPALLQAHLDILMAAEVPHVSAYALTVEPKTLLDQQIRLKQVPPVNESLQQDLFFQLVDGLQKAGLEQYEISNFARPSMESRHNSSYWKGLPYLGLGPSAHSFNGTDERRWNVSNNSLYLQAIESNQLPFEAEKLSRTDRINEYLMIALRTREGLEWQQLKEWLTESEYEHFLQQARNPAYKDKLIITPDRLQLTTTGRFFADGIAADFFLEKK